jgi:hypothetical protein
VIAALTLDRMWPPLEVIEKQSPVGLACRGVDRTLRIPMSAKGQGQTCAPTSTEVRFVLVSGRTCCGF